jgi:hypothetical protein
MTDDDFPGHDTLFDAMTRGRERVRALVDRLGEQGMTDPTDTAGWTGKDHVAHLTAWERSLVTWLRGGTRAEGLGVGEALIASRDIDAINEAIRQASRDQSLASVLANHDEVRATLREQVASMSLEDLHRPYSHYPPDDPAATVPPVYRRVLRVVGSHVDDHLGYIEAIAAQD